MIYLVMQRNLLKIRLLDTESFFVKHIHYKIIYMEVPWDVWSYFGGSYSSYIGMCMWGQKFKNTLKIQSLKIMDIRCKILLQNASKSFFILKSETQNEIQVYIVCRNLMKLWRFFWSFQNHTHCYFFLYTSRCRGLTFRLDAVEIVLFLGM